MINVTKCKLELIDNGVQYSSLNLNNCTEHKGTTSRGKNIHYFTTNWGPWTPSELLEKFGNFQVIYENEAGLLK